MKRWWIKRAVKGILFVVLALSVMGLVVMSLWNALVPDIFGGVTITFWQALGLILLSRLLLGFGPWGWGSRAKKSHWMHKKWEEKMSRMTPEEREKWKKMYSNRCGHWFREKTESASQEAHTQSMY